LKFPRIRLVREKALTGTPEIVEALSARRLRAYPGLGGTNLDLQRINSAFVQAQAASYGYMYQSQPAVRSVVDYIARNVAQLGLKLYRRVSDDEREHEGDHPAAETLRKPNPWTPGQKFVFNVVADFLIYDNAYALKFRNNGGPLVLLNVPPHAVGIVGQEFFSPEAYRIWRQDGTWFDVAPEDVFHWGGYDPENPKLGFSKLETLREELAADAAARAAKTELDKSGGMPKGWMERPVEAAEWSDVALQRFQTQWANWAKTPTRGIPVAEDGMQFKQASVSPEQAQMLESRQFTREEVASEYGLTNVPPRSDEERRQVYADVLPPYCEMLCAFLDLHILQGEFFDDELYFEFNLDEKQMSDDRLKAITSAVGAPPLTRNEGRALLNLPAKPDGDELITPLNVTAGGKPSPQVMPIQDPNKPSQDGDFRSDEPKALTNGHKQLEVSTVPRAQADMARQHRYIDEVAGMLERNYARQHQSLKDVRKGRKGVFDVDRWDRELSEDIHRSVRSIVEREGGLYVARLTGDDFDMRQVENYLKAMAQGTAEGLNRVTKQDIAEMGVEDALGRARGQRAEVAAAAIGTRATMFARQEAAKQAPSPELRTKTWVSNTDRHSELSGVTVPLNSSFGGLEPGSAPNCRCTAVIS
jgi:HK97 family phage portal protein